MTNASGNPSGFMLMLYSAMHPGEFFPSNSLGILNGTANPATSGIFNYTPALNLTLSPSTTYFLVLTAGTTGVNGAYECNLAGIRYDASGGWRAPIGGVGQDTYQSVDGLNWGKRITVNPQFAIAATAIPEPGLLSLLGLGGLGFLWQCRKAKGRS
jgi:hypothetical protein